MKNKKLRTLIELRNLLIEYKRYEISLKLSDSVEDKFPTMGKPKQKIKSIFN